MVLFALLIVGAAVVLGFYASANGGSHDVNLFGQTWNVYDWVPPVIAASVMGLLLLLCMAYAAIRIGSARRANAALRTELENLRTEVGERGDGRDRDMAAVPAAERQVVGRGGERERELEAGREHAWQRGEPGEVASEDDALRRPVGDREVVADAPRGTDTPARESVADGAAVERRP